MTLNSSLKYNKFKTWPKKSRFLLTRSANCSKIWTGKKRNLPEESTKSILPHCSDKLLWTFCPTWPTRWVSSWARSKHIPKRSSKQTQTWWAKASTRALDPGANPKAATKVFQDRRWDNKSQNWNQYQKTKRFLWWRVSMWSCWMSW